MPLLKKVNVDEGGPHPYLFLAETKWELLFFLNLNNGVQQSWRVNKHIL